MLIHILTPGGLPWTRNGVPKTTAHADRLIREKRDAKPEQLCRGLPDVFEDFLIYCRKLKFAQLPDYQMWREKFAELARENGWEEADGRVDDDFYWPPRPTTVSDPRFNLSNQSSAIKFQILSSRVVKSAVTAVTGTRSDVHRVLDDLANLNLNDHQIPGAKKPGEQTNKPTARENDDKLQGEANKENDVIVKKEREVIVVSSGDESNTPPDKVKSGTRWSKAAALMKLASRVPKALHNSELADLVHEFLAILQSSRSKTVTREAFSFLEALQKQLRDPSIFIVNSRPSKPSRPSRTRSAKAREEQQKARTVVNKMWALSRDIANDKEFLDNTRLANMIMDFEALVRKSSGRSVNKDGLAFLTSLEDRLKLRAEPEVVKA